MSPNLADLLDRCVEMHTTDDPYEALQTVEDTARPAVADLLTIHEVAVELRDLLLDEGRGDTVAAGDLWPLLERIEKSVACYCSETGYDLDAALGVISEALDAR